MFFRRAGEGSKVACATYSLSVIAVLTVEDKRKDNVRILCHRDFKLWE